MGSSPRLRGEGRHGRPGGSIEGIIPAPAGRSPYRPADAAVARDHPRACGEKCSPDVMKVSKGGSSPRLRGEGVDKASHVPVQGIIPAPAGRRLKNERKTAVYVNEQAVHSLVTSLRSHWREHQQPKTKCLCPPNSCHPGKGKSCGIGYEQCTGEVASMNGNRRTASTMLQIDLT